MHEILFSGDFREELQQRIWGRGLSRGGPIGSCSVIHLTIRNQLVADQYSCREQPYEVDRGPKPICLKALLLLLLLSHFSRVRLCVIP